MELLETLGINWKILLGQIINFLILFYLLKRFAYKRFLNLLKERRQKIEEGIKKSEEAEKRIEMINIEREKILSRTQEKALEILKKNEKVGKERAEKILLDAQKDGEEILRKIREEGAREIEKIKKEESEKVLNFSLVLAEKILKEKIDSRKDKEIIQKFLVNLKHNKEDEKGYSEIS